MQNNLTDFVCAAAAANHSPLACDRCEFFKPPPLVVANELPPHSKLLEVAEWSPTTAWFTCLTAPLDDTSSRHADYVRAAVLSARLHAPSLAPHVILLGADGFGGAFEASLRAAGATPVRHRRLSFEGRIPEKKRQRTRDVGTRHLNLGAWCRLDVPRIVRSLDADLRRRKLDPSVVLYTDTDVLFAGDVPKRDLPPLSGYAFAGGLELFSPHKKSSSLNTGVMLIDVARFEAELPGMLEYAERQKFRFKTLDQALIQEWFSTAPRFRGQRAKLPGWANLRDDLFNGRAFIHPRKRADQPPRMWHWHGYKPEDVQCWIDAMRDGTWPKRSWREQGGDACYVTTKAGNRILRGACKMKPIIDSPCRYLGRIEPGHCFLRTYTYLLAQHRALLEWGRSAS